MCTIVYFTCNYFYDSLEKVFTLHTHDKVYIYNVSLILGEFTFRIDCTYNTLFVLSTILIDSSGLSEVLL